MKGVPILTRRVVITGFGIVSPIGNSTDEYWRNLLKGISGAGPITRFQVDEYRTKIAAEIKNFNPLKCIHHTDIDQIDTFIQYALFASIEAWNHAKLSTDVPDLQRVGIILGSSNGGDQFLQDNHLKLIKNRKDKIDKRRFIGSLINSAPINLAKYFGIKGPAWSIGTACASGSYAIGEAKRYIQLGKADIMIAGGTDDGIRSLNMAGLSRIKAMTTKNDAPHLASSPFHRDRDGFLMGAGSGIVILEDYEHAKKRGAPVYTEIIGYGTTSDAHHIVAPDHSGIQPARAMNLAIKEAKIIPDEIDYINAHGTGTLYNERMEAKSIHKVFQENANNIPINAIKSMTGHMLGASGAVEFISTILSIVHRTIPATINCEVLDESLNLNIIRENLTNQEVNIAMTNSFGFGGHNASLILERI